MKLRYLFFNLCGFIFLISYKPLFAADNTNENIDITTTTEEGIRAETIELVGKIRTLLQQGYSIDETIAMLDKQKEYSHDIEKLVNHVYGSLNKQGSQNSITNIVVKNEQLEEFYARKNFRTKVKRIVIILIVITACYLLFKYRKMLVNLSKSFWGPSSNGTDEGERALGNNQKADEEELQQPNAQDLPVDIGNNQTSATRNLRQPDNITGVPTRSMQSASLDDITFRYVAMVDHVADRELSEGARRFNEILNSSPTLKAKYDAYLASLPK
jgi:hypothetical protein